MSPLGLYLHVPFCTRRCDYCDFYAVVGRLGEADRFVRALAASLRATGTSLDASERAVDTIYIGGGTPSLLTPDQTARLIGACREAFDVAGDAEVTLEVNPEGIERSSLRGWLMAGVNRLSVGVQTLSDEGLRRRGRLHTAEQALGALRAARDEGFGNVGADLIAGLPDAGDEPGTGFAERFTEGIRRLLAERPDHLSIYLFETDKNTPLMRAVAGGRERLPADDAVADAYLAALREASKAGYERYEIASFSLPGRRSRHNLKYWTGGPFLGFGPSAHSHFRGRRFAAPSDVDLFFREASRPRCDPGPSDLDYSLPDAESEAREALVLALRLAEGADLADLDRRWGTALRGVVEADLADPIAAGLVTLEGPRLRLTERGVLLANEVFLRIGVASSPCPRRP